MSVDINKILQDKSLAKAMDIIKNTGISYHPSLMLGNSDCMQEVRAIIDQVATTDITVLLGGESGTGKELVARSIFKQSNRSSKPFVKILCAAIPDGLLESELFGHEKGSFTGAHSKKPGKFEFAEKGTIFLDEIGEIPFSLQAKLLQVIQDREFTIIGGREHKVDVRIIVATNKNLEEEVHYGRFREDLYYRLNVVSIILPPLRDRIEDLPLLIALFLEKFRLHYNKMDATISNSTIEMLMEHNWPGNVRELENVIKRLVVLGEKHIILKKKNKTTFSSPASIAMNPQNFSPPGLNNISPNYGNNRPINNSQYGQPATQEGHAPETYPVQPGSSGTAGTAFPPVETARNQEEVPEEKVTRSLKEIAREASLKAETTAIREVLSQTHWNRKAAAKQLQISYKALLYKIKECGLEEN